MDFIHGEATVSPSVTADGLTFAYPSGHSVFANLSLAVAPASLMCVTGRSGAGKSTLLYCLAGVLAAAGKVTVMGRELPSTPSGRAALRLELCGFIFQRGELLPELTVLENVALPLRLGGVGRRGARAAATDSLDQLGIGDCGGRTPDEISGGQAQRASVARALIRQPPVVFADEPTASLDASSRDDVIGALRAAVDAGTTVICASHDPALIAAAHHRLELTEVAREPVTHA